MTARSRSTRSRAICRTARAILPSASVWQPLEPNDFPNRFEAELSARRRDGSMLDIRLDDVYGNASRPAAADDVLVKFRANAGRALGEQVRALEDALMSIDGDGFAKLKPLLATKQ